MKEFKVGEQIILEAVETDKESCEGCFFNSKNECEVYREYPCSKKKRTDYRSIIFKEVKK